MAMMRCWLRYLVLLVPLFDGVFYASELRDACKCMVGKASGPDGWSPDALVRLPTAFWEAVATVWTRVLAASQVPQRWSEARVALIPKAGTDEFRPLSIACTLWRLGARCLVKKLEQWSLPMAQPHGTGGSDPKWGDGRSPHAALRYGR